MKVSVVRRQAVIERVDDRLLVDRQIERLADGAFLELRPLEVEIDRLDRALGHQRHHALGQRAGLGIVVGGDDGLADQVDVAGLELGVEHRQVGDVFEDQLLEIGALAEIVGVGDQLEMVARHALAPFERTGADRAPD